MKQILKIFLFSALFASFYACSSDDNPIVEPIEDVKIIDTVKIETIKGLYSLFLTQIGVSGAALEVELAKIQYDVVFASVEYKAVDPLGKTCTLSGLVGYPLLPLSEKEKELQIASVQHGTIGSEADAPSKSTFKNISGLVDPLTFVIAAHKNGYIMLMPDYFGYGADESGLHFYEHKPSLASASRGLVEAISKYNDLKSLKISSDKLFLLGYSEGGFATMATLKSFSENSSSFTSIKTLAGAGGYDTEMSMKEITSQDSGDPTFAASYAWVLLTYNKAYKINRSLDKLFQPNAVEIINKNKYQENDLIIQCETLPPVPTNLFNADFIKEVKDGLDTQFLDAFKDNNVSDFDAKGKVYLIHGESDEWVPPFNTNVAYDRLLKRGVQVEKTMIPKGTHGSTYINFILKTIDLL